MLNTTSNLVNLIFEWLYLSLHVVYNKVKLRYDIERKQLSLNRSAKDKVTR